MNVITATYLTSTVPLWCTTTEDGCWQSKEPRWWWSVTFKQKVSSTSASFDLFNFLAEPFFCGTLIRLNWAFFCDPDADKWIPDDDLAGVSVWQIVTSWPLALYLTADCGEVPLVLSACKVSTMIMKYVHTKKLKKWHLYQLADVPWYYRKNDHWDWEDVIRL